jgi:hypothetical protein
LLNCGSRLGETEGERSASPLGRDGMPGYTGVVAEEESASGIEGESPAGAFDDR